MTSPPHDEQGRTVVELTAHIARLETELVAVLGDRTDALEHVTQRHGSERKSWEDERVQLLQQLAQEAAGHAAVSRTLEALRQVDAARGDELAATAMERDAALRRLAHDADLHAIALMEVQEAARDSADRAEEVRRELESLHQQITRVQADHAQDGMTATLAETQLRAEVTQLRADNAQLRSELEQLRRPVPAPEPVLRPVLDARAEDVPDLGEPAELDLVAPDQAAEVVASRTVLPDAPAPRRGRIGLRRR